MWIPTATPILETVFIDHAPDAASIADVFGDYPRAGWTYRDLAECVADGTVF